MKQAEHLFEAIGLVEDRLVEEAAGARRTGSHASHWKKWTALAACMVLVLGISSLSLTVLFRGCGASAPGVNADSAAAGESSATTDSASGPEENTDGAEQGTDSAMTDDEALTGDSAADGGATAPADGAETRWAGPVMPLDAPGAQLSASRQLTLQAEDGSARVSDVYQVENGSDASRMVTFTYPLGAGAEANGHTVTVDGKTVETEWVPAADVPQPQSQTEAALSGLAQASFARLSFAVEIPAGGTVEIRVDTVVPATVLDGGVQSYDLISQPGEGLSLTEQTAMLQIEGQGAVVENENGFADGQEAALDPEAGSYTLLLLFS